MKKKWQLSLILILFTGFCSFPLFAVIENAFMFRPIATIESSRLGGLEIMSETPSVPSASKLGFNAIYTVGFVGNLNFYGSNIGPLYNLMGTGLEGVYIGVYPGFLWVLDEILIFTTLAEIGYQRVSDNIIWGGNIGVFYDNVTDAIRFNWGIKIGYAYVTR